VGHAKGSNQHRTGPHSNQEGALVTSGHPASRAGLFPLKTGGDNQLRGQRTSVNVKGAEAVQVLGMSTPEDNKSAQAVDSVDTVPVSGPVSASESSSNVLKRKQEDRKFHLTDFSP